MNSSPIIKTLRVKVVPIINGPIKENQDVFAHPPKYIVGDIGGRTFRIVPGQDFLNLHLSMLYFNEDVDILTSAVELRLLKDIDPNFTDDVLVILDGHHRLLFSLAMKRAVKVKLTGKTHPQISKEWKDVTYKSYGKTLLPFF